MEITSFERSGTGHISCFRRKLKWVLGAILFFVLPTILFYVYLDLTGTQAWTKTKTQFEAAGISLDPSTYIPLPVPDAENFAALPIFELGPDPKHIRAWTALALDKALDPIYNNICYPNCDYKPGMLPFLGFGKPNEEPPDMAVVRKQLLDAAAYHSPPIQMSEDASPSEMLGLICPALADLRAANITRPLCRFNLNYSRMDENSMAGAPPMLYTQYELNTEALTYEETLALFNDQAQLCRDDLKVGWKINSGLQKVPLLSAGEINSAIVIRQLRVVHKGLDLHVWNDQQLADLDQDLGKMDFLTEARFCLYGDFAICEIPLIALYKMDRSRLAHDIALTLTKGDRASGKNFSFYERISTIEKLLQAWIKVRFEPNGCLDQNLADHAQLLLSEIPQMLDVESRRVFPKSQTADSNKPVYASGFIIDIPRSISLFACAQVQVDEARIACRLERYRLAHGAYPDSLDAILADYGELPHDIMSGKAYHYNRQADGTYLLYSSGWKQEDDENTKPDPSWDWNK